MVRRDGRYCACFEDRLPKVGKSSIRPYYVGGDIERFQSSIFDASSPEKSVEAVREALKKAGLDEYEIEIVFDRFYDELTFLEMVKRRGWTSVGSASHAYKKVLQKLRKKGFSFK